MHHLRKDKTGGPTDVNFIFGKRPSPQISLGLICGQSCLTQNNICPLILSILQAIAWEAENHFVTMEMRVEALRNNDAFCSQTDEKFANCDDDVCWTFEEIRSLVDLAVMDLVNLRIRVELKLFFYIIHVEKYFEVYFY